MGGPNDGYMMPSGFHITPSSELMSILAIARDLADLRQRLGAITLAYDKHGNPVTAEDLEVGRRDVRLDARCLQSNTVLHC